MGASAAENDGSVARVDLTKNSPEVTYIVEPGQTHTPKQIQLDEANGKLYWCDREGGRIQRCNLDGSGLETLYDAAPGEARPLQDGTKWCVGIAIDTSAAWSTGRRRVAAARAGSDASSAPASSYPLALPPRSAPIVETLFHNLPEPIDLELDFASQKLFWTDRGDPPFGNSLNSADVSAPLDASNEPKEISRENIVAERFHEAIGLALDRENKIAYVSDLLGSLWSVGFNGEGARSYSPTTATLRHRPCPKFRRS